MRYYFLFAFGLVFLFGSMNVDVDYEQAISWNDILQFVLMTTGNIVCVMAYMGWAKADDRPKGKHR